MVVWRGDLSQLPKTISWILKSEKEDYSIGDFSKDRKALWSGVRNYQARNFMMKDMKKGDYFGFYHSNCDDKGIGGIGLIEKVNQPDITQFDPKSRYYDPKATKEKPIWFCCEVSFVAQFKEPLLLSEMKGETGLADLECVKTGTRLSVHPVSAAHSAILLGLIKKKIA